MTTGAILTKWTQNSVMVILNHTSNMLTNPEFMLALGFAIGIVAGLNIARFCWPDEGTYRGDLNKRDRELRKREREIEKKEKNS
jgi:hypothetical protein